MKLELNFHPGKNRAQNTPILFVHGMAHAAWAWEENFIPFYNEQGYDCYALSLRGHGGSEGKEALRWASINDYLKDVKQTIDQLPKKPIVFGHSMGGFILQKYLLEHDDLAAYVGIAAVPHTGMWRGAINLLIKFPAQFFVANLKLDTAPFSESEKIVRVMCLSPEAPLSLVHHVQQKLQSESYRAFLDLVLLNHHRAAKLKTPMLMLHSNLDVVLFENEMRNSAELFGADFKTFDDVGHDMFLDVKWKSVAAYTLEWLRKNVN